MRLYRPNSDIIQIQPSIADFITLGLILIVAGSLMFACIVTLDGASLMLAAGLLFILIVVGRNVRKLFHFHKFERHSSHYTKNGNFVAALTDIAQIIIIHEETKRRINGKVQVSHQYFLQLFTQDADGEPINVTTTRTYRDILWMADAIADMIEVPIVLRSTTQEAQ